MAAVVARGNERGVRIEVRVLPRASRTGVSGIRDGRLVIRVTAPPVDRAANDAALEALAAYLRIPRGCLRIVAGGSSRNKTIEVGRLDAADVQRRLGGPTAAVTAPCAAVVPTESPRTGSPSRRPRRARNR